ncbi:HGL228Wp [Eremothecium sinecaudum]|uniref:HGL228Wp n=1 Tax=Eremothecium sinecaudum TaxID=45286 RepID=A0A109V006_9SACH|nr:HGL228Wp [Eremothecium sinecaudum]AMD22112.1 HGL228Wp [Eremothecium sinecaudum]
MLYFELTNFVLSVLFVVGCMADDYVSQGCYSRSDLKDALKRNNQYKYQSQSYCKMKCGNTALVALIEGDLCYCGDDDSILNKVSPVEDSKCSDPCKGYPYELCGGDDFFTVFLNSKLVDDIKPRSSSSSSSSTSRPSSTASQSSSRSTSSSSSSSSSKPPASSAPSSPSSSPPSSSPPPPTPTTTDDTTSSSSPLSTILSTSEVTTEKTIVNSDNQTRTTVITATNVIYVSPTASSASSSSADPTTTSNPSAVPNRKSLSGGAIAGIVVGVAIFVALALLLAVFLWHRREDEDSDISDFEQKRFHQPYSLGDQDPLPAHPIPPTLSHSNNHGGMAQRQVNPVSHMNGNTSQFSQYPEPTYGQPKIADSSLPDVVTESRHLRIANPDN